MKKQDFSIIKKMLRNLIPMQAIAQGIPCINSLITGILIGQFAKVEGLAVIGFAGPLTMLINSLNIVISTGTVFAACRYLGKGDRNNLEKVFNTVLTLCLSIGAVLTLVLFLFPTQIAILLGAKDELIRSTADYIRGYSLSALFMPAVSCLLTFLQISQRNRASSLVALFMLVVNAFGCIFNFTLIGGGMMGFGSVNSAVYTFAFPILLLCVLVKSKLFRLSLRQISFAHIKEIIRTGLPSGLNPFLIFLKNRVFNHFLYATGGQLAVSAWAVASTFNSSVASVIREGYCSSTRIVSGILVGQRDVTSLRNMTPVASSVGIWYFGVTYLLLFALAKPLALLSGATTETVALYTTGIRLVPLWMLSSSVTQATFSVYHALNDYKTVTLVNVISTVLCTAIGIALSYLSGFCGLACANAIGDVLTPILMAVLFAFRAKRLPKSLSDLCFVPNTLSAPKENRLDTSVHSEQEACLASEALVTFAKGKGMDAKTAYYAGLCLEEILVFTVQNRFNKKSPTIDVRALYEDGKIKLLIRDDCPEFDPDGWISLCSPEDREKSLGIRMVKQLATEMNHSCNMGINTVTITV